MGRYAQHIVTWTDGTATTTLDMFADEPQDLLDIPAERLAAYKRMTTELLALYGARHWNNYHSMLTLSDDIGFQGIEHHESSDDRARPTSCKAKTSKWTAATCSARNVTLVEREIPPPRRSDDAQLSDADADGSPLVYEA